MNIVFRRKKKSEWLVLFMLFMPYTFSFLFELLGLPQMIRYTLDVAWVFLMIGMMLSKRITFERRTRTLFLIIGAFFLISTISFAVNYQSIFYYLWGMRNNIRFFVFFFACIFYINPQSKESYLKAMDVIYWINIPLVLYQCFVLGYSQDYLGGIFGVEKGCNAYMNMLLVITITKSLLYYFNKQESTVKCFAKCMAALAIAALSELKVFYIEFILILLLATYMTKFSMKKIWIGLAAIVGIAVSLQVLSNLFPVFEGWFSIKSILGIIGSEKGYTSNNDMNRLTIIPMAMENLLPDTFEKLFGLGMGNCDYAAYDFLTSNFYHKFRHLNYYWFSTAYLILETGIVGTVLYVSFFIAVFFMVHRIQKQGGQNVLHCQLAKIVTIMVFIILIYNNSMRMESGFMIYFILALPFIKSRPRQRVRRIRS